MVEGKSGKGFRPMGDQRSVAGSRAGTARCDWTFGGNVLFRRGNLDASRFPPAPLLQEAPRAKASPHQQRSGNRVAGKNPDLSGFLPGQKELRSGPLPARDPAAARWSLAERNPLPTAEAASYFPYLYRCFRGWEKSFFFDCGVELIDFGCKLIL